MKRFDHILFPVDYSEICNAVRPFVACMAQRYGARLTLIHANFVYTGAILGFPVLEDLDEIKRRDLNCLEGFAAPMRQSSGLPITCMTEVGEPALIIAAYAQQHAVNLIMMPTHGHGPFRNLLLGSVAAKVLHDSACAVWTAAHTTTPMFPRHCDIRSILCAIDLEPGTLELIRNAVELGKDFNAAVRLVHAVPGAAPSGFEDPGADFRAFLMNTAAEQTAKIQGQAGLELPATMEAGPVAATVRRAAANCAADLIIIGRGKLHSVLGRLRTNAYAIIRESPCPVISL